MEKGVIKMKLYHIAMGWTEISKLFVPRVPETRAYGEDDVTKRICLSTSIEGCFNAMANKPYQSNTKITLYEVNTDDYVSYEKLYSTGKVYDAYLTHECWYLQPIIMTGKHLILKNFESDIEFVPDETRKDEFLCFLFDYLENHKNVFCSNEFESLIDGLESHSVAEILFEILPPYFDKYLLDMDDICADILSSIRIMYNLEFY